MWQYTAGRPLLSQPTKLLMAIRIVKWFFSSLARGISHSFTNTQNTQPREQSRLVLAPSAKREESGTLLCILCFCGLTRAKLPQATSNADLSSRVGQPGICKSTGLSSRLFDFCWLVSSALLSSLDWPSLDCSLLQTVPGTFLPSSSFVLVGDLARKPFVWVSRQNA